MAGKQEATEILDELLSTLDSAAGGPSVEGRADTGDAINAELAGTGRSTRVLSLRESPEARAFREALLDGLIRADTANKLLRLVNDLILRILQ